MDGTARREETIRRLAETGRLEAAVKVPDAVAPLVIDVDLRARQVTTSVDIAAPKDGRAKTRVTWLLRQLRDAPPALRIDAAFPLVKETTSELLGSAHENPDRLLMHADPRREPRSFKVAMSRELGMKRGKTNGSFVYETKQQVADFYRLVVQRLKPWQPGAPKLPSPPDEGATTLEFEHTAVVPDAMWAEYSPGAVGWVGTRGSSACPCTCRADPSRPIRRRGGCPTRGVSS